MGYLSVLGNVVSHPGATARGILNDLASVYTIPKAYAPVGESSGVPYLEDPQKSAQLRNYAASIYNYTPEGRKQLNTVPIGTPAYNPYTSPQWVKDNSNVLGFYNSNGYIGMNPSGMEPDRLPEVLTHEFVHARGDNVLPNQDLNLTPSAQYILGYRLRPYGEMTPDQKFSESRSFLSGMPAQTQGSAIHQAFARYFQGTPGRNYTFWQPASDARNAQAWTWSPPEKQVAYRTKTYGPAF